MQLPKKAIYVIVLNIYILNEVFDHLRFWNIISLAALNNILEKSLFLLFVWTSSLKNILRNTTEARQVYRTEQWAVIEIFTNINEVHDFSTRHAERI
jgi:hypothetical protein